MDIPQGHCQCGCGQRTTIATRTRRGTNKGEYYKFVPSHHYKGEKHSSWKGGKTIRHHGYIYAHCPIHPRSRNGYVFEHILIAEKSFGNFLPSKVVVHHINGNPSDNRPENLVICQDEAYHRNLHRREKALKACGHAHWLRCSFCKQHDDPDNMYVCPKGYASHRECRRLSNLKRIEKRRAEYKRWYERNKEHRKQYMKEYRGGDV